MNSGYSGVDPKFPGSSEEYSQNYLQSHSEYYNHMQAAQHYGYAGAAAMSAGYPGARDPMGYSNYYQQCGGMTPQQVTRFLQSWHEHSLVECHDNTRIQQLHRILQHNINKQNKQLSRSFALKALSKLSSFPCFKGSLIF